MFTGPGTGEGDLTKDYSSQMDYVSSVSKEADQRQKELEEAFRAAFSSFIERREVEIILFCNMTANDLAAAITEEPRVLKSLLAACNLAGRSIERDLKIKNLDTYSPHFDQREAGMIAGYLKPFLPPFLEIHALTHLDRTSYVDKEIRKLKGRWEQRILESLNSQSGLAFRKRKFTYRREKFEIDAATPLEGRIRIGIDVKRTEARKDIHKRCDEIVNKSRMLKSAFRGAKFGVVFYYPFVDEHTNVTSRLKASGVDYVAFAGESNESVTTAVKLLLSSLKVKA